MKLAFQKHKILLSFYVNNHNFKIEAVITHCNEKKKEKRHNNVASNKKGIPHSKC